MTRVSLALLIAIAGCGKKSSDATADKPAEAKPVEAKPVEARPKAGSADDAEPIYKPTCAKLLPKELVDKLFAGLTLKASTEGGEQIACVLQKASADAVKIAYDCSVDVRANGPGGFLMQRDTIKGAKPLSGVGAAAYQPGDNAYRVLGDDAPCALDISWTDKAPANALDLVRAIVAACTMSALK